MKEKIVKFFINRMSKKQRINLLAEMNDDQEIERKFVVDRQGKAICRYASLLVDAITDYRENHYNNSKAAAVAAILSLQVEKYAKDIEDALRLSETTER